MARGSVAAPSAKHTRVLGLALALALLVASACGRAGAGAGPGPATRTTAAGPSTPTLMPSAGHPLPAFSDWRAAYLGSDGVLHAATLDGQTDVAGPELPGMDLAGLGFASAGLSPNGHLLAYVTDAGLNILDVSGRESVQGDPALGSIYQMYWSLDGSVLALDDGEGSLYLAKPSNGLPNQHAKPVPGTPGRGIGILLGWVDSTHVVVTMNPTADSITLGKLDVTSGTLQTIVTIRSSALGTYSFTLSPDGSEALFYNRRFRDQPYTPMVDLVGMTTGMVTPLPSLAAIMGSYSGFTSVSWRPGSGTVAASTGFAVNHDLKTWILDVTNDTAWHLADGYYAMGWSPSSSTLVVSTVNQFTVGQGPFELDAFTVTPDGHGTSVVLTRSAMSFPFVGFVRTT